jgi:alpha-L-fucosidase 2
MMEAESAAFICQNVWDLYAFTQDREFLAQTAWPLLKGAAQFWVDSLQELPDGHLTVSPSFSPEQGPLTLGTYYAIEIVEDLFRNCIEAGEILKTDADFCAQLKRLRARLVPLKVGEHGQLCEWVESDLEKDVQKNKHRHHSHLFALYPGRQITPSDAPALAAAVRQSLAYRGDGGTGWAVAWRMSLFARLHDGNRAWDQLANLLCGRMLPNLWDSCPPFQIDGNFGATAGIAELLLQSRVGGTQSSDLKCEIDLLPALPKVWPSGSIKGLKARGNVTVDIEWKDSQVSAFQLRAPQPQPVKVRVNGQTRIVTPERG